MNYFKNFLKINDKRFELPNLLTFSEKRICEILYKEYKINSYNKLLNFINNEKIIIFDTLVTEIEEKIDNKITKKINIKKEVYEKGGAVFDCLFKSVKEEFIPFLEEIEAKEKKKKLEEVKIQKAKEYELEQKRIKQEKKKKKSEEKELHRLANIGKICDRLFEIEFSENYENSYSGNATLKIKPFIEGHSVKKVQQFCGQKYINYSFNNDEKARIQVGLSERGTIEFRW